METWLIILISVVGGLLLLYLLRQWFNGPRAKSHQNMEGKVVIVTGSSAGIGKETARNLLSNNATVIFANRDENKTEKVIQEILKRNKKINPDNMIFLPLDLSNLKSVKHFADKINSRFKSVDILINNAGIFNLEFQLTKDGIESTFQTNHISNTILTGLLIGSLSFSSDARLINVGSNAHKFAKKQDNFFPTCKENYYSFNSYGISKLANVFLADKLKEYCETNKLNIKATCLHPGAVFTEIARANDKPWYIRYLYYFLFSPFMRYFMKTEEMGAQTTLELCYIDREKFIDGAYYEDCKLSKVSPNARDPFFLEKINQATYDIITTCSIYDECIQNENFKRFIDSFNTKHQLVIQIK